MNERHFSEVEKTLLFISEARKRAERAARELGSADADRRLVVALVEAEQELEKAGRRLMQKTYFATDDEQLSFEQKPEQLIVR